MLKLRGNLVMEKADLQEELNAFVEKVQAYAACNLPSWLAPNSNWVGIKPGHNLDLLEVAFDFRIDRTHILLSETPPELQDPSKPDLNLVKDRSKNED